MLFSPQVSIERTGVRNKVGMVSPLNHPATFQHKNLISIDNGRESMSNEDGRLSPDHSVHSIHNILEEGEKVMYD